MAQVGYLGVVIPDADFWQGYFIDDAFAKYASAAIDTMRGDERMSKGGTVLAPLVDIPDADQPLVGNLCSIMVDTVLNHDDDLSYIGLCGYAIRQLIGQNYFFIEGRQDDNGVFSTIHILTTSSIEEAREAIGSSPQVTKIKMRMLRRLYGDDDGTHRP